MLTMRLFLIGILYYAHYVASERRCAFIRPIPPKKEPFVVDIKATPDTIKLGLTKNATLTCSGGPERGVVKSITITKGDSKVAMVTPGLEAKVLDGSNNLQVEGQTDKASQSQPFIQLIWQLPSKPDLQVSNKRILFKIHNVSPFCN